MSSDPRRPDDARLSTADLAAAGERTQPGQTPSPRPPADRDVTREVQQARNEKQAGAPADATAGRQTAEQDRSTPLFAGNEADDFRHRWGDIQTGFVDEPRQAVERADALVAAAIKRLAEIFAQERSTLEQQWARGADVSTEDLRVSLRRYRGFFDRLLSV
jgi:hypothetical protein